MQALLDRLSVKPDAEKEKQSIQHVIDYVEAYKSSSDVRFKHILQETERDGLPTSSAGVYSFLRAVKTFNSILSTLKDNRAAYADLIQSSATGTALVAPPAFIPAIRELFTLLSEELDVDMPTALDWTAERGVLALDQLTLAAEGRVGVAETDTRRAVEMGRLVCRVFDGTIGIGALRPYVKKLVEL
ncbi:hypothetical protein J8273_5417 [Carpediemonas membranifera]|uniref:Uncharacterized protein n=1 Tax=Carpediemonas membranifera TaxID=201153 RepID=A0A8J6B8W5_9EUKA|nr:hypothetical protein J8273_5417 [Carpediemonas membranifera]|eukprot:KAG9392427.1 hypothetical protein J8273_5417 [Carpediemonas membranifera]